MTTYVTDLLQLTRTTDERELLDATSIEATYVYELILRHLTWDSKDRGEAASP